MTKAKPKKGLAFKFAKPRAFQTMRRDARQPAGDRRGNGGDVPVDPTDQQGC